MHHADRGPVVVDVSEMGHLDAALEFAAGEAAAHSCGVHLVHAVDRTTGADRGVGAVAVDREARDVLVRAIRRFRGIAGERTSLSGELFHGPTTTAIAAVSRRARLVVLQRGDRASSGARAGRLPCDELAVHSHAPVAVVPDLWSRSTRPGLVVTLGLDAPRLRSRTVHEAVALARARGATLRVVHAWWSPLFQSGLRVNRDRTERWVAAADEGLATALAALPEGGGIPVEIEVVHGRPAEVLAAASETSCVVVVGRGEQEPARAGTSAGPVAAALVHSASCPVVLVPIGLELQGVPAPAVPLRELARAGQPA